MDFMTVGGLILGLFVVYQVMAYGNLLDILLNPTALVLIIGGCTASIMIGHPWSAIKYIPSALRIMLFPPKRAEPSTIIRQLVKMAVEANRTGVEDLKIGEPYAHPFLEDAVKLLSEGLDAETVQERLAREIHLTQQRQTQLTAIFRSGGAFAPIFGLLGTLIGIIQVLRNITDTEGMGRAMSIAMISSFYGIFTANFFFLPAATKLAYHSEEDVTAKEIVARGIHAIQKGEAPWMVYKRLEGFLSYRLRAREQEKLAELTGSK